MRLRENASRAATSPLEKSSTAAVHLTFKGYESNEFSSGQSVLLRTFNRGQFRGEIETV